MRSKTAVLLTFLIFSISLSAAATQKALYTFTGGLDGAQPYAGLVSDAAGNLYGVTEFGGLYDQGIVFELTPSPDGTWTESVLYNFTGHTDGGTPIGGLGIDGSGNLYGSTVNGGDPSAQCGTTFELSPSGGAWTFAVQRTFLGAPKDGCAPGADMGGGLTTVGGGRNNQGSAWDRTRMFSFGANGGSQPWGSVNSWGLGTAFNGGTHGLGTVYYLNFHCNAKPEKGGCAATVVPKHAFGGGKNGANPLGNLLNLAVNGEWVMYGTTYGGGIGNQGLVYQLTEKSNGGWTFKVLYRFSGSDGTNPGAGLIADSAGNLYGTTIWGGTDPGYGGTVFKLSPGVDKHNKKIWNLTTLYSFTYGEDGGEIYSGVIADAAGNLYGTTVYGGAYGQGVVYQITP